MLSERWQRLTTESEPGQIQGRAGTAAQVTSLAPVCFAGPDAINFLQGYLTIDLEQLGDGQPQLAALTNLKGRVVASGWAQTRGSERLDWIIHRGLCQTVSDFMARYLAFSKTSLIEPEPDHLVIGSTDPAGIPAAQLICSSNALDALLEHHQPVDQREWTTACIANARVVIDPQTTDAFLPQMIGLVEAGAVDFDKGCYLGQEVVARAQHRGEVKRRTVRLSGADDYLPAGTAIQNQSGKDVGTVLMSEPPLCLAVVRQPNEPAYQAVATTLKPA